MLEEAYELHRTGRLADAEARYREWLGFNPDDPDAIHLLAVVRRQRGAIGEALQLARQAVSLRPDRAGYYVTLAGIEFHARQWAAARADFETALKLDPNQTSSYSALGHIARIQGDDARAEDNFKKAMLTGQERADVLLGYGNLLADRGDFAAAVQYLSRAVDLEPDNSASQASFGRALLGNGQWAFAVQALRNAIRLRPESPGTLRLLIRAHREAGELGAAMQAIEELSKLPEQATATALERAELSVAAGDREGALAAYAELRSLQPDDQEALHAHVALLRQSGRIGDAIEVYRERLERVPGDVRTLRGIGALLVHARREDEALGYLEQAAKLAPDDAEALTAHAVLLERSGKPEEAEQLARAALAINPQQPSAAGLVMNAAILRGDGTDASAIAARIDADSLPPAQRVAWLGLSGCAADLAGDTQRAFELWKSAHAARGDLQPPVLRPLGSGVASLNSLAEPGPAALVDRAPLALLIGPPGSSADLIAALLSDNGCVVLADRFHGDGRRDGLSKLDGQRYSAGIDDTDARLFARQYDRSLARLTLPAEVELVDWLSAWDARISVPVKAVFGSLPLILALDDPRETLLNWLAFGSRAGWAAPDPLAAARWLAIQLEHLIATAKHSGLPVVALNSTELIEDPQSCGRKLGTVLKRLPLLPGARYAAEVKPVRTMASRFPPGEWKRYAQLLEAPFAEFDALAREVRE